MQKIWRFKSPHLLLLCQCLLQVEDLSPEFSHLSIKLDDLILLCRQLLMQVGAGAAVSFTVSCKKVMYIPDSYLKSKLGTSVLLKLSVLLFYKSERQKALAKKVQCNSYACCIVSSYAILMKGFVTVEA